MDDEPLHSLATFLKALGGAAREDAELRDAARALGRALVRLADEAEPAPAPAEPDAPARPAPLHPTTLRIGDVVVPLSVTGTADEARAAGAAAPRVMPAAMKGPTLVTAPDRQDNGGGESLPAPPDLSLVAPRCRTKAEACRWVIDRRRATADDPAAASARDRELFSRAKGVPDCYLWMMAPHGPSLPDDEFLRDVAGCYDALADAVELVATLDAAPDGAGEAFYEDAFHLLAEAQSAVRVALLGVDRGFRDPRFEDHDQRQVFHWLKQQTRERQIYVTRYMRLSDEAPPGGWPGLRERVAATRAAYEQRQRRDRDRHSLLNKARYHANRAVDAAGDPSPGDWEKLLGAVESLVRQGVPPSDLGLRELVLPLLDDIPEDLNLDACPGVRAVLSEVDRHLSVAAARGAEGEARDEPARGRQAAPEVLQVAEWLRGRKVVLIGGARRPHAQAALEAAFGLEELVWIHTLPHESVSGFAPAVARPETALVMLAIRWSSHSFGEVQHLCEAHGKPFVRLPAGYNPHQVARQILQQVSGQLSAVG